MKRSIPLKKTVVAAMLLALVAQTPAEARDPVAASVAPSEASAASAFIGTGIVVVGSLAALGAVGSAVVTSVETVGTGTVVVLRGVSDATTASVRVAGAVSVAAGSLVEVVALATGCALMQAGRMIAFIPNEVGRSLVRQHPSPAVR